MSDWGSADEEEEAYYLSWRNRDALAYDDGHDAPWPHRGAPPPDPSARMPEKWRFLWKWFNVLKFQLHPSESIRYDTHDVRIGREPDDWRIDVSFLEEMRRPRVPLETALGRIRKIREALLITTLFAEADYNTWLSELMRTSRFHPANYMDLDSHRLQRKYAVTFFGDSFPDFYKWERLQHFFGIDNYSKDFLSDLRKLAELAAEEQVDVYAVQSVPIELHFMNNRFCQWTRTQQCEIARNISATVWHITSIEYERRTKRRSKRLHGAPVFNLDEGIIMNFRAMEIRSRLFEEIRRLVDSGVHIKSLTLPSCWLAGEYDSDEDVYDPNDDDPDDLMDDALDHWVPLARSLTGNSYCRTRVNRLVLSAWYCTPPLLAAFCSALATATELKFLRLETCTDEGEGWQAWAWLGYALFNKASTSSVEGLSLAGFELDDDSLNSLKGAMNAKDPLAHLWRELTEPDEGFDCNAPSSRREVFIARKAMLDIYDPDSFFGESIEAPSLMSGIAMDEGSTADIMVPGLGFCQVDSAKLGYKRQRCFPPSNQPRHVGLNLTTLLVDFQPQRRGDDPLDAYTYLPRLLKLIGKSLTSLSIYATDLDDYSLRKSLAHCPRIKNLSLGGMKLKSIDVITELDVRLASLELRDFSIGAGELGYYLYQLYDDEFLERIRIGDGWSHHFRASDAEKLQETLEQNAKLQLVHLLFTDYLLDPAPDQLRDWNCKRFNKQLLTIPMDSPSRFAFLSVLRPDDSTTESCARSRLSEDIIKKVFEFAGSKTRRKVIEARETGFGLGRYA